MDNIQVNISYEPSPAAVEGISVDIRFTINQKELPYCLDMNEFFVALEKPGITALLTCDCGTFGCGGNYTKITHTKTAWQMTNLYAPNEPFSENELVEKFTYTFSWKQIFEIAEKILDSLCEIQTKYPNAEIFSGTYGEDISGFISKYKETLSKA